MSMNAEFIKIYSRDLDRLTEEIKAFKNETNIWKTTGDVKNSAGNLCLHLIGNLKTYIGKNIGNYDFIRDRDSEFNLKDVPRERLLEQIEETKEIVLKSLNQMNIENLEEPYKENVLGYTMSNGFFLIHLVAHLSYHLGQINYLRRI